MVVMAFGRCNGDDDDCDRLAGSHETKNNDEKREEAVLLAPDGVVVRLRRYERHLGASQVVAAATASPFPSSNGI